MRIVHIFALFMLAQVRVRSQAEAPAPAEAVAAPVVTSLEADVVIAAVITSPGNLITEQPSIYYGNVSAATVQDACSQIAAGATTVEVTVNPDDGKSFTVSLELFNPDGGQVASTGGAADFTAVEVGQACVDGGPNAQGTEFLFKDQNGRDIAVICDAEAATTEQAAGSPFAKDPTLCRVYLLGSGPQQVIQAAQAAGVPDGAVANATEGTPLDNAVLSSFEGEATAGKRRLQQVTAGKVVNGLEDFTVDAICKLSCGLTGDIYCYCITRKAYDDAISSVANELEKVAPLGTVDPNSCFPGNAEVDVLGSGPTSVSKLRVGDQVASIDSTGARFYDEVYFFGHQSKDAISHMVQVQATTSEGNATVTMSNRHFVPVGASVGGAVMTYAKDVKVGDSLMISFHLSSSQPVLVTAVDRTVETGLFNPYTKGGMLLVNGVLVSAHSEFVLDGITPASLTRYLPGIYQTAFMPVYWIYQVVGARGMQSFRPENYEFVSFLNLPYTLGTSALLLAGMVAASKAAKKQLI